MKHLYVYRVLSDRLAIFPPNINLSCPFHVSGHLTLIVTSVSYRMTLVYSVPDLWPLELEARALCHLGNATSSLVISERHFLQLLLWCTEFRDAYESFVP